MIPVNCPPWEYEQHRDRDALGERVERLLDRFVAGAIDARPLTRDSRPVHLELFQGLTPIGHEYYAGNYRGAQYPCLLQRDVFVQGDPRVGVPAQGVSHFVAEVADRVEAGILALDDMHQAADSRFSKRNKLLATVALSCSISVSFLEVHPYLNGNGHAARFILWAILTRYGYWPEGWPIDPRPPDPPYVNLIIGHRNGDVVPLEQYVLGSLGDFPHQTNP